MFPLPWICKHTHTHTHTRLPCLVSVKRMHPFRPTQVLSEPQSCILPQNHTWSLHWSNGGPILFILSQHEAEVGVFQDPQCRDCVLQITHLFLYQDSSPCSCPVMCFIKEYLKCHGECPGGLKSFWHWNVTGSFWTHITCSLLLVCVPLWLNLSWYSGYKNICICS